MCEQCEVLREENRQLREMLFCASVEEPDEMQLLTKSQRVLYRLLLRWPVATHEVLTDAMVAASPKGVNLDDPRKLASVQICKMRKRLAPLNIEIKKDWGVGYRLIREAA